MPTGRAHLSALERARNENVLCEVRNSELRCGWCSAIRNIAAVRCVTVKSPLLQDQILEVGVPAPINSAAPVLTPEALPADRSSAPAATPAAPSLVVSLSSWTTPFPAAGLFSFAVMFGTSHFCIPQSHPKAPYYTQIF